MLTFHLIIPSKCRKLVVFVQRRESFEELLALGLNTYSKKVNEARLVGTQNPDVF